MPCWLGTVFRPRKTIQAAQNFFVEVGENATLYCISNHPNSTYTWKHNDSLLQIANRSRFSFIIDGVLQIHNVVETDGGLYKCASTALYPVFGKQIRSTVVSLTVYMYSEPISTKTNVCTAESLFVRVGLPSVNLTLTQDGNPNSTCNAINSSETCRFDLHPNVSVITIECDYDGSTPLLVQIFHNAVILFQRNVTDDQRSVTHTVSSPSSGIFQCIASNPYGSKQISIFVRSQSTCRLRIRLIEVPTKDICSLQILVRWLLRCLL